MICRLWLCTLIASAMWTLANISQASDIQCPAEHSEWNKAYRALEIETENLRNAKNDTISDRVRQDLDKQKKGVPIAKIIREILRDRSERLSVVTQRCKELLRTEQLLFDHWRKCSSASQKRQTQNEAVVSAIRDRNKLQSELNALMLDEAFAQYRKEAPQPVAAVPQQQRPGEPDRRADYDRSNSYYSY